MFLKKVLRKREEKMQEKMQEKMKITKQKDRNLVQVKPQCSLFLDHDFFWLVRPLECLIWVILTMTKYHENLLRDSALSLLSIVNFFTSLEA